MQSKDKKQKKYSGVLCAVSSLPSGDGIGTFGKKAYDFVDFLIEAKQRFWQILPLNLLGEGNSPYKSVSCFAGEILYIDLSFLVREGLLDKSDIGEFDGNVDYNKVREYKLPLLFKAAVNFDKHSKNYKSFIKENGFWLDDYAIFVTALSVYKTEHLTDLPDGLKYRIPDEIEKFENRYKAEISLQKTLQYFFFCQYFELKNYAEKNGIKIIGDIPFYVSVDSADVWVNPDDFCLNRDFTPKLIAGVPPDIFSKSGQMWGNPIYNWQNMRQNGYSWWKKRLEFCRNMYDVLRIDHFRAFANYYQIPSDSKNALSGEWQTGEGINFWNEIEKDVGKINVIAEDLGGEDDPDVKLLLKQTDFANMKILQFAFDGDIKNQYLPQNYPYNCVCYTGTHDNDTALGWYENATQKQKIEFDTLINNCDYKSPSHRMICDLSKSNSMLCIIPMQDLLGLNGSARMNTPATESGNWEWRMCDDDISDENAKLLKKLTAERN